MWDVARTWVQFCDPEDIISLDSSVVLDAFFPIVPTKVSRRICLIFQPLHVPHGIDPPPTFLRTRRVLAGKTGNIAEMITLFRKAGNIDFITSIGQPAWKLAI